MTQTKIIAFPKIFTATVPPPHGVPEMMVRLNITVTASLALKIFALIGQALASPP